jgi:uncharacterized membrane protein
MEWWKIGIVVFFLVYAFLILYQIVNPVDKYPEKIKSAMARAEKKDNVKKKIKKVDFYIESHSEQLSWTEYLSDIVSRCLAWILSILYSIESYVRKMVELFNESVFNQGYVFLRKSGVIGSSI